MAAIAAIRSVIYDICLPVTITYETESFQVDKAWIGGAFVLGIKMKVNNIFQYLRF
jgi:hypothetical protein